MPLPLPLSYGERPSSTQVFQMTTLALAGNINMAQNKLSHTHMRIILHTVVHEITDRAQKHTQAATSFLGEASAWTKQ